MGGKALLNAIYPVGSIYMSVNSTSPATLFGGTWERIKDRFLLAAGDAYAAGGTGGEATHTLTEGEMPAHSHVPNTDAAHPSRPHEKAALPTAPAETDGWTARPERRTSITARARAPLAAVEATTTCLRTWP